MIGQVPYFKWRIKEDMKESSCCLDLSRPTLPAVPWLRRLVAVLSPRWPGFAPGLIHVGFVVDKVALGQDFLLILRFPVPVTFHRRSPTRFIWGWTVCPLVAVVQRRSLTPSKSINQGLLSQLYPAGAMKNKDEISVNPTSLPKIKPKIVPQESHVLPTIEPTSFGGPGKITMTKYTLWA
jgi:hypothetical protein